MSLAFIDQCRNKDLENVTLAVNATTNSDTLHRLARVIVCEWPEQVCLFETKPNGVLIIACEAMLENNDEIFNKYLNRVTPTEATNLLKRCQYRNPQNLVKLVNRGGKPQFETLTTECFELPLEDFKKLVSDRLNFCEAAEMAQDAGRRDIVEFLLSQCADDACSLSDDEIPEWNNGKFTFTSRSESLYVLVAEEANERICTHRQTCRHRRCVEKSAEK